MHASRFTQKNANILDVLHFWSYDTRDIMFQTVFLVFVWIMFSKGFLISNADVFRFELQTIPSSYFVKVSGKVQMHS